MTVARPNLGWWCVWVGFGGFVMMGLMTTEKTQTKFFDGGGPPACRCPMAFPCGTQDPILRDIFHSGKERQAGDVRWHVNCFDDSNDDEGSFEIVSHNKPTRRASYLDYPDFCWDNRNAI